MRACVRVCVRAYVRACGRACGRACICLRECMCVWLCVGVGVSGGRGRERACMSGFAHDIVFASVYVCAHVRVCGRVCSVNYAGSTESIAMSVGHYTEQSSIVCTRPRWKC